jgi:uncharacterized protein YciI
MSQQQYLYQIVPTRPAMLTEGPTNAESGILQEHVVYLEHLADDDIVLLAGRTQTADDTSFGIVILLADSDTAAQDIVSNDPAVLHNVMRAQLFPYRIAVLSQAISKAAP